MAGKRAKTSFGGEAEVTKLDVMVEALLQESQFKADTLAILIMLGALENDVSKSSIDEVHLKIKVRCVVLQVTCTCICHIYCYCSRIQFIFLWVYVHTCGYVLT
jgi:hypothetical protein